LPQAEGLDDAELVAILARGHQLRRRKRLGAATAIVAVVTLVAAALAVARRPSGHQATDVLVSPRAQGAGAPVTPAGTTWSFDGQRAGAVVTAASGGAALAGMVIGADGEVWTVTTDGTVAAAVQGQGLRTVATGLGRPAPCRPGCPGLLEPAITVDQHGQLFVSDPSSCTIHRVAPSGSVRLVAGNGRCSNSTPDVGRAAGSPIGRPASLTVDHLGSLFFVEADTGRVRKVDPAGNLSTLAAGLDAPAGIVLDQRGGLLVSEQGGTVVTLEASGAVQPFAGPTGPIVALLDQPGALLVTGDGSLFVADSGACAITRIRPRGTVRVVEVPGSCPASRPPAVLAVDRSDDIWFTNGKALEVIVRGVDT